MFDQVDDAPWTIRIGKYTDTLARQPDGEWLFTERRLGWIE